MKTINLRYKVVDQAEHGCCNTHSVWDTSRPVIIGGEHYDNKYEAVCECLCEEYATRICAALNKAESR